MRADKFLWTVRLYKTRSLASKACSGGIVTINDEKIKPAKIFKVGDYFEKRETPIKRTFEVLDFPKSRVGAKLVCHYLFETTSEEDLEKLSMVNKMNAENKKLGIKGRPTKKDRRNIEKFRS